MIDEEFHRLLDRYLNGNCSKEERRMVEKFYQHHQREGLGLKGWKEEEKQKARRHIRKQIWKKIGSLPAFDTPQKSYGSRVRVAASIALLIGLSIWMYLTFLVPNEVNYLTKTTARGQKSTITLSDGSVVQLNAESSVIYPDKFLGKVRDIKLEGEAFFEVQPNPEKPFTIKTGDLITTVLGTSFNIQAYPEDPEIEITVATGKVSVETQKLYNQRLTAERQILTPSHQAVYNRSTNSIETRKVVLENSIAWKKGVIRFDDISLRDAIKILERWFNVTIELEKPHLGNCYINSTYREENLVNILNSMKFINGIEYEFIGKDKIMISGDSCKL